MVVCYSVILTSYIHMYKLLCLVIIFVIISYSRLLLHYFWYSRHDVCGH